MLYRAYKKELDEAIIKALKECGKNPIYSKKSKLSHETVVRFLIGAEGGSLDTVLQICNSINKGGAVYRSVCTVLWEVGRSTYGRPPTRLFYLNKPVSGP